MTGGPIPRVLLAGMSGGSHPGSAAVGAAAPDFQITDVKGRRHDLGRYRGKTLHLFFFAEWCPPCVDQLRTIELADARLRGRGYAVLAIGMKSREDEGALRTFADERTLSFPVAWDADGSAARAYGVDSIPVHVIVGPNGSIRYRGRSLPEGFDTDGAGLLPG